MNAANRTLMNVAREEAMLFIAVFRGIAVSKNAMLPNHGAFSRNTVTKSVTSLRACDCLITLLPLMHYRGNVLTMPLAHSKLTAQGQISVPAGIRKKLGIGPGSVLEWDEKNEEIVVRKAGQHTLDDVHNALFPQGRPKPDKRMAATSVKEGIKAHMLRKYARG